MFGIIVYIILSIFVTKLVYDFIFRRPNETLKTERRYIGETYLYSCEEDTLAGYLYRTTENNKKLVVVVPGFKAEAVQYAGTIHGFAECGFDVFSFDCTGCGNSNGKSSIGFPQAINDLNATLKFIEENKSFGYNEIFLFGHSRGGYAACCVVNEHPCISGVISVNGVNTAMDGVMACSVETVGRIAFVNYCFLWLYQIMIFGKDIADRYATKEINKCKIPILVVQSVHDEKIPIERFSLYSQQKKIHSKNVSFFLYCNSGNDGHTSIICDPCGKPNKDIILKASEFFENILERRPHSDGKHGCYTGI